MIKLGNIAKRLRESQGINQRTAAEMLDVSVVHLCNIENNKSSPSADLISRYRENWGVDLYVLAWCLYGDVEKLPPAARKPTMELAKVWKRQFGFDETFCMEAKSECSTSET